MINKNQYTVDSDKKVLHKIGKHWAVASTLMLGLAGGAIAAGTVNANADTTTNQPNNNSQTQTKATTSNQTVASNGVTVPSVKTQINNNLDKAYQANQSASSMTSSKASVSKPSSVQSQATNMYRGLMLNATKPSNSSSSSKPSFNSAYQNYMAKMSGADAKVASANDNNADSNSNKNENNKTLLKDNAQPDYFDGGVIKTGNDCGLNYKIYKNGGIEFTNGIAQSNLGTNPKAISPWSSSDAEDNSYFETVPFQNSWAENQYTMSSDFINAKAIKFDSDINTSHVTNMDGMLSGLRNLKELDLGNSFNTINVTSMNEMFTDDTWLYSLTLPSSFNTSNVTNMSDMFHGDTDLKVLTIKSPQTKFTDTSDFNNRFQSVPPLYKKDSNDNYTSVTPNDFSKGNVGTFVLENPAPSSDTATVNYMYNDKSIGSFTTDKRPFDTTTTAKELNHTPNGYQLITPNQQIKYNGTIQKVNVKQVLSFINVIEYVDKNGSDVGDTSAYGQEGTDVPDKVIEDDVPRGYQISPNQTLPVQFTKNNVIPITVQNSNGKGDMVVGTAYLTLLYKRGNRTDGQVLKLHINGNIGDSDIIINPQDYDKPGYQVSNGNAWHIPFDYNDVKHNTNDFSRYNVKHTFTYQANPTKIQIEFVDTQTGRQALGSAVQTFDNIAYDGDTIDLQEVNNSNGIVAVDGSNYRLNLPTGYHLDHANNYIKVTANGTYIKKVSNGFGGFRMVRMPLMKLTLGITPHFNRPNTNSGSVTPVKPSSASSITPSSANSASPSLVSSVRPSSASVAPSSATQSVVPSSTNSATPSTVSISSNVQPIIPSDNVIVPSKKPSKHSVHARNNNSGIVNGKTRNKSSKAKNRPNMIKHNRRVNRNVNVVPSHANNANVTPLVAKRNVDRTSYTNAKPVHVNVPKPTIAKNQHTNSDMLPQTNEDSNTSAIVAVLMLLTSIGFAGVDLERKHSI